MLTLNDGRNELWQWDTGRKLNVDVECSQVHFSNKVFGRSVDVDVVDGTAIIPDFLLQTDKDLLAWAYAGSPENGYTKISKVFKVNRRNKPSEYVFTPVDQMTMAKISAIAQSVRNDADSGKFNGKPGEPGADGKSAYQQAVDGGYTGTEAEFAEKLASESGAKSWNDLTDKPFYTEKIADKTTFTIEEIFAVEPVNVGSLFGVDYLPAYRFSDVCIDKEAIWEVKLQNFTVNGVDYSIWIDNVDNYPDLNSDIAFANTVFFGRVLRNFIAIASVGDDLIMQRGLYFAPLYIVAGYQLEDIKLTIEIPQEKYHRLSEEYMPGIFVTRVTDIDGVLVADKTYAEIKGHAIRGDVCIALTPNGGVFNYSYADDYGVIFTGTIKELINDDTSISAQCIMQISSNSSNHAYIRKTEAYWGGSRFILKGASDNSYFSVKVDDDGNLFTQKLPM